MNQRIRAKKNARTTRPPFRNCLPFATPFLFDGAVGNPVNVCVLSLLLMGVTFYIHKKYLPGALMIGLSVGFRLAVSFLMRP